MRCGSYDYRAQEVVYRYDLCRQSAVVPNIAGGTIFADAAGERFVEGSALLDQVNFWNRDGSGLVSVSTRRRPNSCNSGGDDDHFRPCAGFLSG